MVGGFLCLLGTLAVSSPAGETPAELLRKAQDLYRRVEIEAAEPLARLALEHPDVTPTQEIEANFLLGSVYVVLEDQLTAEQLFRLVLRGDPEFGLPASTPPHIAAVFKKVESEERELREKLRRIELERLIASLRLTGGVADAPVGGHPLVFLYRLEDRGGAVNDFRVQFRRRGEREFSSIPLTRDVGGSWQGEIPAELTVNDQGLVLEFFLETLDREGTLLLTQGSSSQPLQLSVEPGELERGKPIYKSGWFWGILGTALAGASIAAGVLIHDARTIEGTNLGTVRAP